MVFFNKLSTKEIDKTIDRIKEEYDHGIAHFGLHLSCKRLFEARLQKILLEKKDMMLFLSVEIQVVQELVLQAEQRFLYPQDDLPPPPPKTYADRVIEKLQNRIKKYPELSLGDLSQKNVEVEKLYGALEWFSKNIWNDLYSFLVKKNPSPLLYTLDDSLTSLVPRHGKFPKVLERYVFFLTRKAPIEELVTVQNQCLLTAAHFLHKTNQELEGLLANGKRGEWVKANPTQEEIDFLEKSIRFVGQVLYDFRLRDLKPVIWRV